MGGPKEAADLRNFEAASTRYLLVRELARRARRRRSLASAVHDQVGQALVLVKLQIQGVLAEATLTTGHAEALRTARAACDDVIGWARDAMAEMGPPGPEAPLAEAVSWLADRLAEVGALDVAFVDDDDDAGVDPPPLERMLLVEGLAEVLDNVKLHARATHVRVELRHQPGALIVEVEDDGEGFDPESLSPQNPGGLPLVSHLLAGCGGEMELWSSPGHGTRTTLRVPAEARSRDEGAG